MKKELFLFSVVIIGALGPQSAMSVSAVVPGGDYELGKCECPDGKIVD